MAELKRSAKMKLRILAPLLLLLQCARAATLEEGLAILRNAESGSIAFCKPSIVDELQIVGAPRSLSPKEAQQLGALLGAEETFFERNAAGDLTSGHALCLAHWDFKILLASKDGRGVVALRLCSGCRQLVLWVDGQPVDCPDIRAPAMSALTERLDLWFPGWKKKTEQNRMKWEKELREKQS